MKEQNKKKWQTPELIVLSRSQPEEAVLTNCKSDTTGSVVRETNFTGCNSNKASGQPCQHCDAVATGS